MIIHYIEQAQMNGSIDQIIGERLRLAREGAALSLGQLSARSGVSKTMIARVERAESSATAALLGRLCAALGISLSAVVADPDRPAERVARQAQQPVWTDPQSGYVRRHVSPAEAASGIDMVLIDMPAHARVAYEAWQTNAYTQQLVMLKGKLTLTIAGRTYELAEGDCIDFDVTSDNAYETGSRTARYLLAKRRA